jgi:hypothetical protein
MKPLLLSLLVLAAGNVVGQEAPSFKHYGVPFVNKGCEIAWAAPTNQMPKALWIYKTIPQRFSDKAISNLVALGSFAVSNKMTHPAGTTDKDGLGFVDENEKRYLVIAQTLGYIDYEDRKADDGREPVEDALNAARAQELGLDLLDRVGIPRSELATKPNSSEPLTFKESRTHGYPDKNQGKWLKEVYSRGVFFVRQIDGVSFAGSGGAGGLYVRFASHARVAQLELVWRNLQPYKKYEVASPGQIMQWIKDGKAVVTIPDADKVNPSKVKRLTITEISPLYAGELGEKPQEFTYPFASLDTLADTGQTNIAIKLYCPILSTITIDP